MCRITKRTYHVGNHVALVKAAQLGRRQSNGLHDKSDGAAGNVSLGNGERHALAKLVDAHDDKVASLAALGDEGCLHFQKEDFFGELLFANDFVHNVFLFFR